MELSYYQVFNVLKDEKFKPYKIHITQTLRQGDEVRRFEFCQWLMNQIERTDDFLKNIVWTDECTFTNLGLFNRHNEHYWAQENPRIHTSC